MAKILLTGLTPQQAGQRRKKLALVHQAKKNLGLDDDLYREILEQITGRRSAAELTLRELDKVIEHFRVKGFCTNDKSPASTHLPFKQLHHKITAQWIELAKAGKIQDGSDYALQKFVLNFLGPKQNRAVCLPGIRVVEVLSDTQCQKVLGALKKIREWEPKGASSEQI